MQKLYALIIGINNYPIRSHRLQGCVPDATEMHDFLANVCNQEGITFEPLVLFDNKATRQNIIQGFAHFAQAKDGDICVLYYSGHGSQMASPPEFWKLDTDRLMETIVCYDSRLRGGRDLTDKELSYLIWKYSKKQNKDVHFLSVFDCCHSGTITRSAEEENTGELRSRMADKNPTNFPFNQLVGHEEYEEKDGAIIPPLGNYITLSAARSDESAYEMNIGGVPRGIFTNSMLDVLEKSNLKYITYAELISRIQSRVQNRTNDQMPQHPLVNAYGIVSQRSLFLNGKMNKSPRSYLKYENRQWIVDLGSIHGLKPRAALTIEAEGVKRELRVTEVKPGRSIVEEQAFLDKRKGEYLIQQIELTKIALPVGINPDLANADLIAKFKAAIEESESLFFDQQQANYWLDRSPERGYILTRPCDSMPLFYGVRENIPGDPIAVFIDNIEKVAFWEYVNQLSNPITSMRAEDWVEIEMTEVLEHSNFSRVIRSEPKSIDEEAVMSYQYENGKWREPAFQLKVSNKSNQDLWIAGLYLSEDFSVTDIFMPVRQVRRGEEPYGFFDENGNDIIELWLPDEIHSWGGTEIVNKIKIIVSAEPFTVQELCQDGLDLEHKAIKGGASRGVRRGRNTPQWLTKDILIRIKRPLDAAELLNGEDLDLQNLTIEGHESFSAKGVRLCSSKEAARDIGAGAPHFGMENFSDVNMASHRDVGKPLDVIELNDVAGSENVRADQPLKMRVHMEKPEGMTIVPMGLDEESGLYFPLGRMDEDGMIRIEQMPDSEDGRKRGFLKSFKIYLKGVWYDKVLKTETGYPMLAAVALADENSEVAYTTDTDEIKQKVAAADKILVLVHGILGDTSDKAKIIRRAKQSVDGQDRDLSDLYDLFLTFDYDSLGVVVEDSARALKASLESVGLSADDGKTVHLLTHSSGGLVARWMLEQEGGESLVDHLVMVGCPNLGTPWASAYDMLVLGLGKLINFLPIPSLLSEILGYLGKAREGIDEAVQQFQSDSKLLQTLNADAAKAPIPYTIVAGDVSQIPQRDEREEKLVRRYLQRFQGANRARLEQVLFNDKNDGMIGLNSMQTVPTGSTTNSHMFHPVGSSHFAYFASEEGVKRIGEVLFGLG